MEDTPIGPIAIDRKGDDLVLQIPMRLDNGSLGWIEQYGNTLGIQVYTSPDIQFQEPQSNASFLSDQFTMGKQKVVSGNLIPVVLSHEYGKSEEITKPAIEYETRQDEHDEKYLWMTLNFKGMSFVENALWLELEIYLSPRYPTFYHDEIEAEIWLCSLPDFNREFGEKAVLKPESPLHPYLERSYKDSIGRCISGWQAAGVSRSKAQELADDATLSGKPKVLREGETI